ncbi:type II toxin-antitoxin system RelE/ParE family toxin [Thermodesulfobacteriota bacterium]
MYKLKYRRKARNYIARLPLKTKTAIVKKLHDLCLDPDSTSLDIDTLKEDEGFRLRLGQYRVIYTRGDDYLIIEVVRVRPRGDIYKR